jgi:hypothetical protein
VLGHRLVMIPSLEKLREAGDSQKSMTSTVGTVSVPVP